MDIVRDPTPKKRKRALLTGAAVLAVVALAVVIWRLPAAVPSVDRATVWSDDVKRGTLVRQVRGPGTLVPEQARLITAVTNGRVEQISLLPGAEVTGGEVILRMSNPDVDMQLLEARTQLSQARSQLLQLRATLRTQRLQQEGVVAMTRTQLAAARRDFQTNSRLFETNPVLVARADLDSSRELLDELETRLRIEEERLEIMDDSTDEQIRAQEEQVSRLEEQVAFHEGRLASLEVRAPNGGILAPLEVPLQEGMYVLSGQQLARIVVPGRLKAEIRIPQTQAQEILLGQDALVDTRSDTIRGRVNRIDPSVRGGTVTVDVALPLELPGSARPDLSIDGNVVIEQLDDVVYVGRPTFGQANQRVSLFRVTPDGQYAERVQVLLGASSVNEIEVREGLQPGDVVILSDMSQWDGHDRVRLR